MEGTLVAVAVVMAVAMDTVEIADTEEMAITEVRNTIKAARKKIVPTRITTGTVWDILEITRITNQHSINTKMPRTTNLSQATTPPAKNRKRNQKLWYKQKSLSKIKLPNCQSLERRKK